MKIDLSGKTALVTGSTVGIGRAIAKGLAQSGAAVIVNGRTQAKVEATVGGAQIRGSRREFSRGRRRRIDGRRMRWALCEAVPEVDILVNNAGIFEPKPFVEIPDADWTRFFETNVMSGVRLSRAYLPGHAQAQLGPHHLHLVGIGVCRSPRR